MRSSKRICGDVIPAYQALRLKAQAAFRSGHVEPLIGQTVIGIPQTSRDAGYWVPDLIFLTGFFLTALQKCKNPETDEVVPSSIQLVPWGVHQRRNR